MQKSTIVKHCQFLLPKSSLRTNTHSVARLMLRLWLCFSLFPHADIDSCANIA